MVEVSHFSIKILLPKWCRTFCWDKVFSTTTFKDLANSFLVLVILLAQTLELNYIHRIITIFRCTVRINTTIHFVTYIFMMYLEMIKNAYILWACHGYHKYSNLSTIWNITSRKLRFMQIGLHKYTNISVKCRDIGRPCTNIHFDEYLLQATRCVLATLIKTIK